MIYITTWPISRFAKFSNNTAIDYSFFSWAFAKPVFSRNIMREERGNVKENTVNAARSDTLEEFVDKLSR